MKIFSRLNVRVVAFTALLLSLVWLWPQPAGAVDREHQQLMADIRMLQEQSQQLQALIGGLSDALKAITTKIDTKIDDQTGMTRKAFADEKVVVDAISGTMREIREKVDETNVRLGSLSQEMEAIRQAIPPPSAAPVFVDPTAPPSTAVPPGGSAPAAAPVPLGPGMSPDRLFETAYADYVAGQYSLAIQGFETYLKAFPKGNRADEAQYRIGDGYLNDSKFQEAIDAYDRAIRSYPGSRIAPQAYYKRGGAYERLGQFDNAKQSWETVMKQFPDSDAASLAKQGIDRLNRPAR
jgi:tol-pal system protein YbgF